MERGGLDPARGDPPAITGVVNEVVVVFRSRLSTRNLFAATDELVVSAWDSIKVTICRPRVPIPREPLGRDGGNCLRLAGVGDGRSTSRRDAKSADAAVRYHAATMPSERPQQ